MNLYINKHHSVIKRLTDHGLVLVSTTRQLKKDTLVFTDSKEANVKYGIFASGYVRKATPSMHSMNSNGYEWWQLNKTTKRELTKFPGYFETVRILTDDYNEMCDTIIRVSTKSRNKLNKKI